MREVEFTIKTGTREVTDVTPTVAEFAATGGDGLLNVFIPHATAGVAIIETRSGSEADLVEAVHRLLPRDDRYRHRHGSVGHGADHVLPAFVGPSVTIPVRAGRMRLGTWQSVVVVDTNPDNPERRVLLAFLEG